jgi:hypothetical protein
MKPVIEVVIATDGTSRVQTNGFAGEACRHASQQLEQALGLRTAETLTAEYYERHTVPEHLKEGQ